ncbi:MAG: S41 family peptidase [Pseudomonadota bacterium]
MLRNTVGMIVMAAMLASCGGSDSGGSTSSATPTPPIAGPAPSPTPTPDTCSLRSRQDWVAEQLDEFYLFPDLLDLSVNPADFSDVQSYINAVVAPARAQNRDVGFTFITSIEEENAFFASGTSAGFGIRLTLDGSGTRVFIIDAIEGAPGLNAGIDRGTELLAIGTTTQNLRSVSDILASEGGQGITNALGPSTPGTSRVLRFVDTDGNETTTTVTKTEFDTPPISPRFGVEIFDDGSRRIGYVNMRTFIGSSNDALRDAFAQFRTEGITEVILDLRYNGGGLVSTAELFGDLLGANRFSSDIFSITAFRESLSSNNTTRFFDPQPQSIAPIKIAVIATSATASASELVTNSFLPYLGADIALIGSNTSGKPVGQIAIDREECDDRLRIVAFQTQNADGEGEYFNGLAGVMDRTCRATDDFLIPMGNANETSIAQSLSFLRGENCTPIAGAAGFDGAANTASDNATSIGFGGSLRGNQLLVPEVPTPAQREVPGLF